MNTTIKIYFALLMVYSSTIHAAGDIFKCKTDFISEKSLAVSFIIDNAGNPRVESHNSNNLLIASCKLKIDYLQYKERAATQGVNIHLERLECLDAHGKQTISAVMREDVFLKLTPSVSGEPPVAYLLIFHDLQPSKCLVSTFNKKELQRLHTEFDGAQ